MGNFKLSIIYFNWTMIPFFILGAFAPIAFGLVFTSFSGKGSQDADERKMDSLRVVNYEPSVVDSTDLNSLKIDSKNYYLNASLENSWTAYRSISPAEAWQGPLSELIFINADNKFNSANRFEEGTVVLVRVNLFKNKSSKALFEISKIDDKRHIIEMRYGKQNVTKGLQRISFRSENGITIINHTAFYKSNSGFRDIFYPRFHQKIIDEFHDKVYASILDSSGE